MKKFKLPDNFWIWVLLFFGVVISAPRFAGSFAAALGRDVFSIVPGLLTVEIFSGFALAIFEALGYAFISHRWQQINLFDTTLPPDTPLYKRVIIQNAIYWIVLAAGQLILLISIPIVAVGHLATQIWTNRPIYLVLTWNNILQNHLTWFYLLTVAGVQTLFVFLIGLSIERYLIRFEREEKKEEVLQMEMKDPGPSVELVTKTPDQMSDDELLDTVGEIQKRGIGQFVGGEAPPPLGMSGDGKRVTLRNREI